jgi:hypothetical protein
MDMFLFEPTTEFENEHCFDELHMAYYDDRHEYGDAKIIVRSFFENTDGTETQVSYVSDAIIETALELSKGKKTSLIHSYDPDAAIGWICEEINTKQQNKISPKSRVVLRSDGNQYTSTAGANKHTLSK